MSLHGGGYSRCDYTIFNLLRHVLVTHVWLRGPRKRTRVHGRFWGNWWRNLVFNGRLEKITSLSPKAKVVFLRPRLKTGLLITSVEEV